jgi:hypothetical protein
MESSTSYGQFSGKALQPNPEEGEREAILKDYPKLHCKAIVAPRSDYQVKE